MVLFMMAGEDGWIRESVERVRLTERKTLRGARDLELLARING